MREYQVQSFDYEVPMRISQPPAVDQEWGYKMAPPQCGCREVILVQPDARSRRKTDRRDAQKLSELLCDATINYSKFMVIAS